MIKGLEQLTLVDYPGHIAATVFTGNCNFRCPWCHNKEISYINPDAFPTIPEEEIIEFMRSRISKLEGLCITGGEPTIWEERLLKFMGNIKELGFLVKLDSNGTKPEFILEAKKRNIVDYVAMDIKNIFEKYAETAGLITLDIEPIKRSIEILKNDFPEHHQFRTTMVPNLVFEEDIVKMEEYIGEKIIRQEYKEPRPVE
ncbi:anaerobic ribonucleoside-triphosphate reductase activating protein [bacterium]|nr:anaerobic ribonucleoside-triphosphate reductase activating protein [bacterium]